eukprot:3089026-Prymnesium_polylepis.1
MQQPSGADESTRVKGASQHTITEADIEEEQARRNVGLDEACAHLWCAYLWIPRHRKKLHPTRQLSRRSKRRLVLLM